MKKSKINKKILLVVLGILLVGNLLFFNLHKEEITYKKIPANNIEKQINKIDLYYNIDNNKIFYEKIGENFKEVNIE